MLELNPEKSAEVIKEWMFKHGDCIVNSTVWGKLYKAELIKKSYENVPDELQLGEDFVNFLNLIAITQKFVCVSQVYYNYMEFEKSMSHLRKISDFRKHECMTLHCRKLITEKYDIDDDIADKWCLQKTFGNIRSFGKSNGYDFQYYFIKNLPLCSERKS